VKGIVPSESPAQFERGQNELFQAEKAAANQWIANLRAVGIAMATPAIWADENDCTIHPIQPYFNDGVTVGSMVAIGTPGNFRVVQILAKANGYYRYGPVDDQDVPSI
jgi:hypothetical protein